MLQATPLTGYNNKVYLHHWVQVISFIGYEPLTTPHYWAVIQGIPFLDASNTFQTWKWKYVTAEVK